MARTLRTYTDQDVVNALAQLDINGGNIKRTSRQLAIPHATIRSWRDNAAIVPVVPKPPRNYEELWAQREELALELLTEQAPSASFRDLAVLAGIAADKRYREQHPESAQGARIALDARQQTLNVTIQYEDRARITGSGD